MILLVEDDVRIGDVLKPLLEDEGYEVKLARKGDDALNIIAEHYSRLSALITDIRLGSHHSGWQVAKNVRTHRPDLPVLYISADSAHDHAHMGVPDSIMLQKPFGPSKLLKAIDSVLERQMGWLGSASSLRMALQA